MKRIKRTQRTQPRKGESSQWIPIENRKEAKDGTLDN